MGANASSCFDGGVVAAGSTPLHKAAFESNLAEVIKLLEEGEPGNAISDSGATVLHFAAANVKHGREITKFLLEKHIPGVTVSRKNRNGEEAIHYAIRVGNLDVVKDLLNIRGADAHLMQFCVKQNQLKIAMLVCKHDSNTIRPIDPEGRSILLLAAEFADLKTFLWLIDENVNVDFLSVIDGDSVLHCAARNIKHGWEIIRYLSYFVPSELDVDERNNHIETPVHAALKCNNVMAAKELIKLGADLDIGIRGDNLLTFCVRLNKVDSARFVLQQNREQMSETMHSDWNIVESCEDILKTETLFIAALHAGVDMCKWLVEEARLDPRVVNEADKNRGVLHYSAMNQKFGLELVRFFVGKKINVNWKDNLNKTPLNIALGAENIECIRELLRCGAKLGLVAYEENYLHFCVRWNKLKSAMFICYWKPDMINRKLAQGHSILHVAALYSDVKMFKWLVEKGASDLSEETGTAETSLHFAAKNKAHGNKIASYLVSMARDINAKNQFQETPLCVALLNENLSFAEEIVNLGAKLTTPVRNESLLFSCIRLKKLKSAEFILKKEEDMIRQRGSRGETVLHFAAEKSDLATCQWLMSKGADFRALSDHGSSVMHFAASNKVKNGQKLVCYFSSFNLDLNAINDSKETPLYTALIKDNEDVFEELCKLGADPKVKIDGETLLHFCACLGRLRSAKALLAKEPSLLSEIDNAGRTALHVAAKWSNTEFFHWLVQEGINVDVKDHEGRKAHDLLQ
ncbi:serine/threonine-protein phosphatase 6 regulatory ankyrin repeat subunit B-like [Cloeon dipterum]|uniref:serine/threonine-protein phosphatase 6 regulatory ankyrin repeat subunit B-like n=1 Tax=Cloeon dipterum TaxID=197152 RepID=UPI0032203B63